MLSAAVGLAASALAVPATAGAATPSRAIDFNLRIAGKAAHGHLGVRNVRNAGDVNGDGVPDALLSSPQGPDDSVGSAFVIYGRRGKPRKTISLDSLTPRQGYEIRGTSDQFAIPGSIANAGDVNGDGVPDQLIGAPPYAGIAGGITYVVYGQRSRHAGPINLDALSPRQGYRIRGGPGGGRAANAGDVNGDGVPDQLVGAGNTGNLDPGMVFVVYGQRRRHAADIDLGLLQPNQGYRITGRHGDELGTFSESLASAGDVNGDGVPDALLGAPAGGTAAQFTGTVYVVYGQRTKHPVDVALSSLSPNRGYRIDGAGRGDLTGFSIANAGDVNGDRVPDQVLGAPGSDQQVGKVVGRAYVVFGQRRAAAKTINLATLKPRRGYRLTNPVVDTETGISVSGAGDVNGDGVPDQLVGAPGPVNPFGTTPPVAPGTAYVVFGQRRSPRDLDLTSLTAGDGYGIVGAALNDEAGSFVGNAGDVSGDGRPDQLVTAQSAGPHGYVYVVVAPRPARPRR